MLLNISVKKTMLVSLKSIPENQREGNSPQLICENSFILRAIHYSSWTQMQKALTKY